MKRIIFTVVLLAFVGFPVRVFSQSTQLEPSTQGTDFLFSYGYLTTGNSFAWIKVATTKPTVVTFTFNNPAQSGSNRTVTIPAGEVYSWQFTTIERDALCSAATASLNTMSVHADNPVSVYIMNSSTNAGDATVLLPLESWGTEYYHVTRIANKNNPPDKYIVVAKEPNTTIWRNGANPVTLGVNQTIMYTFPARLDYTGTHITSDKPIAYFVYNEEVGGGTQGSGTGTLYDQLPPVHIWGLAFMVPVIQGNNPIRVIASENGTTFTAWYGNTPTTHTLNAGQFIDLVSTTANQGCWITSDKPIMIGAYLSTFPAMTWIPPVHQLIASIVVAPFTGLTNLPNHYGIVVVPTLNRDQTKVSICGGPLVPLATQYPPPLGLPATLTGTGWITGAGGGNYSYYMFNMNDPVCSYVITHPTGVIVWIYGGGSNSTYFYLGGSSLAEIINVFYVNEIQYDLLNDIVCIDRPVKFRADIKSPLNIQPGRIKWYLDGVEQTAVRDIEEWEIQLSIAKNYTIKLTFIDALGDTYDLETTFAAEYCFGAENDFAVTPINTPVTIPVLNNDKLEDCDVTSIDLNLTALPLFGAALKNINKTITYTPNYGFYGLDSLEYAIECDGLHDTARVYIYTYPNSTWLCVDATASINLIFSHDGASVAWFDDDGPIPSISVAGLSGNLVYPYEVRVTFPGHLGYRSLVIPSPIIVSDPMSNYYVYAVPKLMYWKTAAPNSNWNEPTNWTNASGVVLNAVPLKCTTVHIIENALHYPSLDVINTPRTLYFGEPECDSIYFHFGGEVAKQHYLDYNKALVELTLKPNRWYMTSPPLRNMYPGDYYKKDHSPFEDKLFVYTQLFAQSNPETGQVDGHTISNISAGWTGLFNTPDVPMGTGFGFAVWLDDDPAPGSQHAMWFPKHDPLHYYYNMQGNIIRETAPLNRNGVHRFIYEEQTGWNKSTGVVTIDSEAKNDKYAIVGNPFMAHWDFDLFYAQNDTKIQNEYKIAVENVGAFLTYRSDSDPNNLTNLIAPLQSILVAALPGGFTGGLINNADYTKTKPNITLRANVNNKPPSLVIVATKGGYQNKTSVLFNKSASNNYVPGEDSYKLFMKSVTAPVVVYTRSSDGQALDVNLFGNDTQFIPLGIRTSQTGTVNLQFEGLENFMPGYNIFLHDIQNNNIKINLKETPEYSFEKNDPNLFLDGRLYLSFENNTTNIPTSDRKPISVFIKVDQLQVICSSIIKKVEVFDMQGRTIFSETNIEKPEYTCRLNHAGIYIMKVLTQQGIIVKKIIVTTP